MIEAERYTLSNGLTVLMLPIEESQVACALTWVKVGYFDEPDELTGISHVIEHILFKGTDARAVGEIARETKMLGGSLNAGTIYDHTSYHVIVPRESIFKAIDIQADAYWNSSFNEEEYANEKKVIAQEIRRKYDQPSAVAFEKLLELAYWIHPLKRWRIGQEEQVLGFTREQAYSYYKKYYIPSNTILVVAGGFDVVQMKSCIEEKYGRSCQSVVTKDPLVTEPKQNIAKLKRMSGDISIPLLRIGFKAPCIRDELFEATLVLSALLGSGKSSRLVRKLKEEKSLCHSVSCNLMALENTGLFTIAAELRPDQISLFQHELWNELANLFRDPPTALEMQKIVTNVNTQYFREKEDILGQAFDLAYYEALGNYKDAYTAPDRIANVSREQVLTVAKKIFQFENMSILEYVPQGLDEGSTAEDRLESLRKGTSRHRELILNSETPSDNLRNVGESLCKSHIPKSRAKDAPQLVVKPFGVDGQIIFCPYDKVPLVNMHVAFPGGRINETLNTCGITNFMLRLSTKGTQGRTSEEISFDLESLGAAFSYDAAADSFGYSIQVMDEKFEKAADLLADIAGYPLFHEREIQKEKDHARAMIRRLQDDMFRRPIELFYQAMFGSHPYAFSRNGTLESVDAINEALLRSWWTDTMDWSRATIVVVGDMDVSYVEDVIQHKFSFAHTERPTKLAPVLPAMLGVRGGIKEESKQKQQSGMVMGVPGLSAKDARLAEMEVLRNVLSGMGGRLFTTIREKNSWVYTITAMNIMLMRGGAFFVYGAFSPQNENVVRDAIMKELRLLMREPVSQEELIQAKAYTKGYYLMSLQSSGAIASQILSDVMQQKQPLAWKDFPAQVDEIRAEDLQHMALDLFLDKEPFVGIVRGEG